MNFDDLQLLDCSTRTQLTLFREELPIAVIPAAVVTSSVTNQTSDEYGDDEEIRVKLFISTADKRRLEIGRNDWLQSPDYTFVIVNSPVECDSRYTVCNARRKAAVKSTR